MSVTTLYDYAAELLAACETALGTTEGGVPAISYVGVANPALDCPEQLTVHVANLALDPNVGINQDIQLSKAYRSMLTMIATIVRCTPQPKGFNATPPSPAELEALASKVDQDLWAIWNYLAGLLCTEPVGIFIGCSNTRFNVAQPQFESGRSAGWQFSVSTIIPAYTVVP